MNKLLTAILLLAAVQGHSATFGIDTVDNWQIYYGGKLLTAGIAISPGSATFRQQDAKDLEIVYNHCSPYHNLAVTIEIIDEQNKPILTRHFHIDSGDRMKISKKELGSLPPGSFKIRYRERTPGGADVLLALVTMV